jgi:flavin reductase (DIM6/NTAB) family NADH-FMN oxidoreductase RutF
MTIPTDQALALRAALGRFATGVTIVTAKTAAGEPVGLTINSFTSVSLDPPLILFNIDKKAASLSALQAADAFAVNVLGSDQQELSHRFAFSQEDRWTGVAHRDGLGGAPLIEDTIARFECEPWATYEGGDHLIVVGRVARYGYDLGKDPLLFYGGRYADLQTKDEVKP